MVSHPVRLERKIVKGSETQKIGGVLLRGTLNGGSRFLLNLGQQGAIDSRDGVVTCQSWVLRGLTKGGQGLQEGSWFRIQEKGACFELVTWYARVELFFSSFIII